MRHLNYLILVFVCLLSREGFAQTAVISGEVKDSIQATPLPFATIILKNESDSAIVSGTITNEDGLFELQTIPSGNFILQISLLGYQTNQQQLYIGSLNQFFDVGTILLQEDAKTLQSIEVIDKQDEISSKMDKKVYSPEDNIVQNGGTVLQAVQNLPGVTVQDGRIQLRGSDKIMVLVDGKQTALTGIGNQSGLENIPASAIEKIEIINNPSAKYDANGTSGIVNIIFKKEVKQGFNGKVGFSAGAGALWIKQNNLPTVRPQYQLTPKLNPSVSINYRKEKVNVFFQGDYMLNNTLNKNEFVDRYYDNGLVIRQQTKRNRNTNIITAKSGVDYFINDKNQWSTSILFSSEKILDHGDEPFFNQDLTERNRLWQFLEDELKTTFTASSSFQHKFNQTGRLLTFGYNYTFHRENEKYFFTNILPTYTGNDAFKLLSDEHVSDFTIDYVQPLKFGRIETGAKMRYRSIPTNMQFYPGLNSPIDSSAGGWATYKETIPAGYLSYILEKSKYEIEAGVRAEYVNVNYLVNPNHPTYKSSGYNYFQPFPNIRIGYKIGDHDKLTAYFNRRVDRPNEVDIRIFPKYDDAEIIKVGNPALSPQFSNLYELGYKRTWASGFVFASLYHKSSVGTISRIASIVNDNPIIYSIMQNIGKSYNNGVELVLNQKLGKKAICNLNANAYKSSINAFSVVNLYPETNISVSAKQDLISWNAKFTTQIHLDKSTDLQFTAIYLAPDLIPQGKIGARYSLDVGVKKDIQKGKGQLFMNATDLLNTMNIKKQIVANGFHYNSTDYYETQVIRIGYNYKF